MRKFFVLLMTCTLCITGCGKDDNKNSDNSTKNTTTNNVVENNKKEEKNDSDLTTRNLFCTMIYEDGMEENFDFKFGSNDEVLNVSTLVKMDLTSNLNGEQLDDAMKQDLIYLFEKLFSEENGYKNFQVSFNGNVAIMSVDIPDIFIKIDDLAGYDDTKDEFESHGYTCK